MSKLLAKLTNAGNCTGEDIKCTCGEKWENAWVLDVCVRGQYISESWLQLGPQHDDPDGDMTRIEGLTTCPSCSEEER